MEEYKPGEVIVPQQQNAPASPSHIQNNAPQVGPAAQTSNDTPPLAQPIQPSTAPSPVDSTAEQVPYQPPTPATNTLEPTGEGTISWEADEFIAQEKAGSWYGAVIAVSVVITLLVYLLNRDIVTSALVLVALIGLAAFSGRRPRRQQFMVAPDGIQVGRMFYSFADFRSFAVAEEKVGHSLVLVSLKRFVPAINVYIPPDYEEAVVDLVASILPMEPHRPDFVERFMNRIRF